jgi:hypothetical protein
MFFCFSYNVLILSHFVLFFVYSTKSTSITCTINSVGVQKPQPLKLAVSNEGLLLFVFFFCEIDF